MVIYNLTLTKKGNQISYNRGRNEQNNKDNTRINNDITAKEVRLIGAQGEQIGIVSIKEALSRADEANLDLVEISPNAEPPVCKILDYGKYKFQAQKRASEARKKQVVVQLKEINIRPATEEHDYQIKLKNMRKFLERGDKVKVSMRFRGREIANHESAKVILERIVEDTQEIAKVDQFPRMEGRLMVMMLSPTTPKKSK